MRKTSLRMTRGIMVLLVALMGFMGLTVGPVSAQGEGCASGDDAFVLNLVDPTKDGVITISDLQIIADGLSAESPFKAQLQELIDEAETQGVTGIRYDGTGACAPVTTTPVTTTPVTTTPVTTTPVTTTPVTTTPVTTTPVTTTPVTTTPVTTATVTATTTATATETVTTTATATETVTATDPATTAPDDDGGAGDDDGGAGDDDGVSELPDTGQGASNGQSNSTLVMLLGGMSIFIAAVFLWTQRRAA